MIPNGSTRIDNLTRWNDAQVLHILYTNALPSITGSLGVFLILAVSLSFEPVPREQLIVWTITGIAIALGRLWIWWGYSRNPSSRSDGYWLNGYRLLTMASGLVNGGCVWLFFEPVSPAHQMLILFAISGLTAAATGTHAIDLMTFYLFLYCACLPAIAKMLLIAHPTYFALSLMLVLYILVMRRTARMNLATLQTNLQLTYKMQYRATHDTLVDLLNREEFENLFELRRAQSRHGVAILFIDLDNFKQLNDRIGHAAGDDALIRVAGIIKESIRHDDIAARLGGDEFVVSLLLDDPKEAERIANNIIKGVEQISYPEEEGFTGLGASIGLAFHPDNTIDFSALMNAADTACYQSKKRGKNQMTIHLIGDDGHERAPL